MTTIKLDVNHSFLGMEFTELPFASTLTLGKVKDKLYPRTGTEVQHQFETDARDDRLGVRARLPCPLVRGGVHR